MVELYDHSNYEEEHFALMGFVNEALREYSAPVRQERILEYLARFLGKGVHNFLEYTELDWSHEAYTTQQPIKSMYMSPPYGHSAFKDWYLDGRLRFGGAETSPIHGGYMDGAIRSGNCSVGFNWLVRQKFQSRQSHKN